MDEVVQRLIGIDAQVGKASVDEPAALTAQ